MSTYTVALTGNPNVGKSSLFNALTGLHQHTGNWTGKTVETAKGFFQTTQRRYELVDLPGTYSLAAHSEEERVARDYLLSGAAKIVVVVCDASFLQRSLHLALQCLSLTGNVMICVNFMDEAEKNGLVLNLDRLSEALQIPVVGCTARNKRSLQPLLSAMDHFSPRRSQPDPERTPEEIAERAKELYEMTVTEAPECASVSFRKSDAVLTGTVFGLAITILSLALLLWITIRGANLLSDLLSKALTPVGSLLDCAFSVFPPWLHGLLYDGMWRVLSWVVSVMLPPMAVFFPLFSLLEDAGVLPRIAFTLDRPFRACSACGKQALTCCMGLGCNAVGVVGCRIIDSPRERMLAMLTNCFTPCSGRFPILASVSAMFFIGEEHALRSAMLMTALLLFSLFLTLTATRLLSVTVLRGAPSAFALELPPYRMPQVGRVLFRSVFDRTVVVLGRAVIVAAPAGMVIWLLSNLPVGDVSLLRAIAHIIEPAGKILGLDGVILLAFLLGLPANEIVLPLILMGYLSSGVLPELASAGDVRAILAANHWTAETALCVSAFTLAHWPCSTTILTMYRETHSLKWTIFGVLLPTCVGVCICMLLHGAFSI